MPQPQKKWVWRTAIGLKIIENWNSAIIPDERKRGTRKDENWKTIPLVPETFPRLFEK